jgi:dihydropteroate synthase
LIDTPIAMGIINITPDSFFEGSRITDEKAYLNKAEQMLQDGATIIDIGAQSTRPNATLIDEATELKRVLPVIINLVNKFPSAIFSIDTFYAKVAAEAVQAGASIVNDISAGQIDKAMWVTVADLKVPYVLMHNRGTPQTMQQQSNYNNVTKDVFNFFLHQLAELQQMNIQDVIIDLGFGFAKTIEQNFELLGKAEQFKLFKKPLLTGLSRKSIIWKTLNISPNEALNGTTVLNTIALQKGTSILRVHDVKEAMETIRLHNMVID